MPNPNGADDNNNNDAASDVQQQLSQLQDRMKELEEENTSIKEAKSTLEQRLKEADDELLSDEYLSFKEGKGKPKATTGDELDLDRASNREVVDFLEKKYKGDMDVAVKALKKELDLSRQQIGMMTAQFDIALTSIRHDGRDGKPAFDENKKQIFEIAKANPTWGAEKCYQQFILQSEADAKAKELAAKKKADEEAKAATERVGMPDTVVQDKQLSADEAAELAYRKAFGNKE